MNQTEVCKDCRFWKGGCELIRENRIGELIDYGICSPWNWIQRWVGRFLAIRSHKAKEQKEDILQDLQVFLRHRNFKFPTGFQTDSFHLRIYLRTIVMNRIHDFLRKEKLAPKLRCGVCLYYASSGKCSRIHYINGGGTERANPYYGKSIDPHTNPNSIEPPCREFVWRYRSVTFDEVEERSKEPQILEELEEQEAGRILLLALSELMESGAQGRRQAYSLKEFFLSERTAQDISNQLGLNEKTIRRDIKSGLLTLKLVLRRRFNISEKDII